ncbi:LmbU family transcriptional regulator [Amycolatopsis sp. VS8301801F10]|uniref:LmbU family transcriptional regulator n=1 Tax=Amycolatopsis sp. VS8301801F10 TaxID=2652442 RepID=UPI0038FD367A
MGSIRMVAGVGHTDRDQERIFPHPDLAAGEKVLATGVGLRIPADLSFEEWTLAGKRLSGLIDASAWWLGDWLVFGKRCYADRYQRVIRTAGLRYQTLRNYAWVARRFEIDRRRSALTFQHHAEVASLPFETQERLLDCAERDAWTTKQLRTAIREERTPARVRAPARRQSHIAVPDDHVDVWRKAANAAGANFDHWVRETLDQAAEEALNMDARLRA